MIPDFIEGGILPPGIHEANIDEITQRYGGVNSLKSLRRLKLIKSLKEFLQFIKSYAIEIYIDGSFITSKLSPNDVDVFVVLSASFYQNGQAMLRLADFLSLSKSNHLHIQHFSKGHKDIHGMMNWFTHTRPPFEQEKGISLWESP